MAFGLGRQDLRCHLPRQSGAHGRRRCAGLRRNRHLVGNDFTRTQDQGILILTGLAPLRASRPSVANTLKWMAVLARHTTLDGVGLDDLYRLGRLALSIDPANVRNMTMPGTGGMVGAQSVVFVDPSAQALFADFRDDATLESN